VQTFGERLQALRKEKGLTGEELGKIFSVTKSAVSNWENKNRFPDENMLKKLAEFFNVTLDYLFGRSDIPNPYKSEIKPEAIIDAESLYKVDPEMLIQMCRATDLPEQERQKIKEYSALLIEKFLRERAEKEKDHDK
jgi:transcriptional regulator with XRE-family HTH domain